MKNSRNKKRNYLIALLLIFIVGIFSFIFFRSCDGDKTEDVKEGQVIDMVDQQDTVAVDIVDQEDSLQVKDFISDTIIELQDDIESIDDVEQKEQLEKIEQKDEEYLEEKERQAEEQRRQAEEAELEHKRLEEEARLAEEEAELKRQIAKEEERVMNEGILDGVFSVASNRKVRFSQGNLQYQASTDTWRFAQNQWDYEGFRNENIDPDNVGWIDLFGWGTSSYNKKFPFMISRYASDYITGERNISKGKYDWGVYNPISNGGDRENLWRVLTNNEWRYLFCKRKNASKLFAFATVAGVKGLVVLPDNWKTPAGAKFVLSINNGLKYEGYDEYVNTIAKVSLFDHNVLSINNWRILEENGAVFLPAAGGRDYANVFEVQLCGFYWSGTHVGESEAYMVGFSSGNFVSSDYELRSCGFSVRLVRDIKTN